MNIVACAALLLFAPQQDETTLRVSWGVPKEIDPHLASGPVESRYVLALFEGLISAGLNGVNPVPGMAEHWKTSEDGLTWTFLLRKAQWSDGKPVTAHDFVYAWRRALRPATGCPHTSLFLVFKNAAAYLESLEADELVIQHDDFSPGLKKQAIERLTAIARKKHATALKHRGADDAARAAEARPDVGEEDLGFKALDDQTLCLTLERRTPHLPHLLSLMTFVPLPKDAVEKHGHDWIRPDRIVVNGPYVLESVSPIKLVLKRNPNYWDILAGAGPERVSVGLKSPQGALAAFAAGNLDWVAHEQIPPDEIDKNKHLLRSPSWGTYFLRLNTAKPPFDNPAVRLAFARAVDRAGIAEAARADKADLLVPPGFRGYPKVDPVPGDKAAAIEALLKESNFDLSTFPKINLLVPEGLLPNAAGERLRQSFEEALAINVGLKVMKPPAYLRSLQGGDYQMALGGWAGRVFDPAALLEIWTTGHTENATGWSDKEYDELIKTAAGEAIPRKRFELLSRAEARLLQAAPVIPLCTPVDVHLVGIRLTGLRPNLLGRFPLKHLRLRK